MDTLKTPRRKQGSQDCVMVICAHSDDQIFGVGGTLARYAQEGIGIHTIIFSYGESSHPLLKRKVTVEMRVKESQEADKVINGGGLAFLGLKEGRFKEEGEEKDIIAKLIRTIDHHKPSKIFTHSDGDPHPDHRIVCEMTLAAANKTRCRPDVYTFEVWTPIKVKNRHRPKLVVDITKTFPTKLTALKCFKSQWMTMITLLWSVYARAIINGFFNRCLFAETFYKINR